LPAFTSTPFFPSFIKNVSRPHFLYSHFLSTLFGADRLSPFAIFVECLNPSPPGFSAPLLFFNPSLPPSHTLFQAPSIFPPGKHTSFLILFFCFTSSPPPALFTFFLFLSPCGVFAWTKRICFEDGPFGCAVLLIPFLFPDFIAVSPFLFHPPPQEAFSPPFWSKGGLFLGLRGPLRLP